MSRFENGKKAKQDDKIYHHPPVLDGTASLEDNNEEQPPRVKGLVELIHDYYAESDDSKA